MTAEQNPVRLHLLEELSAREHDVLLLLAEGHSDAEIAATLGLSIATVRRHMSAIRAKLGCHSRVQVLLVAQSYGLLGRK